MSEWSPTRRQFLGVAGLGNVSWQNATDVVPDHPLAPTAEVQWTQNVGGGAIPIDASSDRVVVVTPDAVVSVAADGTPRWRFKAESDGQQDYPDVYVEPGAVYVDNDRTVWKLDPDDGTVSWRFDGSRSASFSGVASDTVLVDGDGSVIGLSATDGSKRWRFTAENDGLWLPEAHGERVYVGTTYGRFVALSASDGRVQWRTQFPEKSANAYDTDYPHVRFFDRVGELVLAFESGGRKLYGLDYDSGRRRWTFQSDVGSHGLPGTVADGTIYFDDGPFLRAISAADGTEQWRYDFGDDLGWSPSVIEDTVFVGGIGRLAAVGTDGTEHWQFDTGDGRNARAVGTLGDAVVVDSHETAAYGLAPSDGRLLWTYSYPGQSTWFPQVGDDALYVGTKSGTVTAISSPGSTPLYDAVRTVTSPAGLAVGGLLGGALAVGAYRRYGRDDSGEDAPSAFEDFELRDVIAEADHVEVHEARTPDGERVALERVEPGAIESDRFAEAVETWADLDVPGVLTVREWGTEPVPWVATDPVAATLADRAGDLATADLGHAVADVAETVHRAHREGVVHGGLTPESVWFANEDVRVGDWRLAAELQGPTDADDTAQLAAMARDLLADEQVSEELDEVLGRALSDDPDERYDSPLKFADALRWAVRE